MDSPEIYAVSQQQTSKTAKVKLPPMLALAATAYGLTEQEIGLVRGIWDYSEKAGELALEVIIYHLPKERW